MRTCIICLPRTGSQLCERMISSIDNATMLGEYVEAWNDSIYALDENKFLFMDKFISKKEPFNIHPLFDDRIKKIINSNKTQPFVLRLFLMDNYNKETFKSIIDNLNAAGFNFLTLYRSLEDQLLSYCIAYSNLARNKNTFIIDSAVVDKVFVNISKIESTIEHISRSNKKFSMNVKYIFEEKNLNVNHIEYESLVNDIHKIYGIKIETGGNKTVQGNHLDYILNKEETIRLINKYLN